MADTLNCEIVTPVKTVFASEASYVALPGEMGGFGVMQRHEPLVSALSSGVVSITTSEGGRDHKVSFVVTGGYAQINDNKLIVLANDAVAVADIDAAAVRDELAKVEQTLASLKEGDSSAAYYRDQLAWLGLQLKTVTEAR